MRYRASIAAFLGAACSSQQPRPSPVPTPDVASPPAVGDSVRLAALRIPRHVAGFRGTSRHDFEDPRYGTHVRYVGPQPFAADVYIYPIIPPSLATTDAGRDSAAALEFRSAREEIFLFQKTKALPDPKALREVEVTAPAGGTRVTRGRRGTFQYQRDSLSLTSHLYVFGLRDRYVKVRSSYRQHEGPPEPPPALERFVQALVSAVAAGYERGDK